MSAIAWLAQPPEIRPEWLPRPEPKAGRPLSEQVKSRRLAILAALSDGPCTRSEIAWTLGVSHDVVRLALKRMTEAGEVVITEYGGGCSRGGGTMVHLPIHTADEVAAARADAERLMAEARIAAAHKTRRRRA